MPRPRKDHGLKWSDRDGWTTRGYVVVEGERVRRTIKLGTRDKVVARRKVRRMLDADGNASPDDVASPLTFGDAVTAAHERWKARKIASADQRLRLLEMYALQLLKDEAVTDIRGATISDVLQAAADKGLERQTVVHIRNALHSVFDDLWRDEVIGDNPVKRCRTPDAGGRRKERVVLTDEEIRTLLADPDRNVEIKMLVLMSRTIGGQRASDLNSLEWSAFSEGFATCWVPRMKTRRQKPAQLLDVPEDVRPFIAAWHELCGAPKSGPVFPVRRGDRAGEAKKAGNMSYAKRLRRELKRALGVERFDPDAGQRGRWVEIPRDQWPARWVELFEETEATLPTDFHSIRRAYSTALSHVTNAQTAAILTGHSDPRVHMRYVAKTIRQMPAGAVPKLADVALPNNLPNGRGSQRHRAAKSTTQRRFSERDTRLEPATLSLGS